MSSVALKTAISCMSKARRPVRDVETIEMELILADMEVLERRIDRTRKMLKSGDKKYQVELDIYERIMKTFEEGKPVRSMSFSEEEKKIVDQLFLLTSKPVLYAANVSEDDINSDKPNPLVEKLVNYAKTKVRK